MTAVFASTSMQAPICTAVIGVGYFGSLHARSYHRLPNSRLVALVDPEPETRDLADQLGVAWLRTVDELPMSVSAVSVATPVDTHYTVARTLLERGIDVLLEKPIAETILQAAHLRALASTHGRILQIGHIERFNPAFAAATGVLKSARCIRAYRASERRPRSSAMDVVVDLMIHDLDLILSECDARNAIVCARGRSHGYTRIDEAQVELTLANGCRVELEACWGAQAAQTSDRRMIVELDDGVWTLDFRQRHTSHCDHDGNVKFENAVPPVTHDALMMQLSAFIEATRTRSAPRVTGEDGHAALELAHRIRRQILDDAV